MTVFRPSGSFVVETTPRGLLSAIQTACKDLPVIILTAHGEWDVYAAALDQGAVEFLNKPISADELRATLERFCPCLCSCSGAAQLAEAA